MSAERSTRAEYWAEEVETWYRVVSRPILAVCIAAGISITAVICVLALGPVVYKSNGWFIVVLVSVCVLAGLACCLCRAWRPVVFAASGAVAVGFAWVATELTSYASEADARFTFDMTIGAFAFAFVYVTVFRPLGAQVRQEQDEATMRRIIREELRNLVSPVEDDD